MNKNNEKVISLALDYLRFPLALIVVLVHVINIDDVGVYISGCRGGMITDGSSLYFIRHIINGFIRGISVPIYLFISGFVFFKGVDEYSIGVYKRKVHNRIHSLLIPYLIWNLLELLIVIFIHSTSLDAYSASSYDLDLSLKNILSCFWVYNGQLIDSGVAAVQANTLFPLNTPLWFLRDLFCVTLISPLIYFVIKRLRFGVILSLFVLWILPIFDSIPLLNQFVLVLFFFSIGAYMAIHKVDVADVFNRFRGVSVCIYCGCSILSVTMSNVIISNLLKSLSIIGALFVLYNLALRKVQSATYKTSTFLSTSSMFIYLAHSLICMRFYKITLLIIEPNSNAGFFMCLVITYVVVITSLLFLYYMMRRYTPRFATILTGRK